jgi:hypothetical protein
MLNKGLTHGARQRYIHGAATLCCLEMNAATSPIDVLQLEPYDLMRPDSIRDKKEENRIISAPLSHEAIRDVE